MFKDIPGYEGNYKINESGIVINKKGHVMRTAQSNSGYLRTALEIPGKPGERLNESIHRLVAKTFLPNPDNLPVVMHIDNDPLNCHVSNLKYGTTSDNIKQAFDENRKFAPQSSKRYLYRVENDETGDSVACVGREAVAELIQYEVISLKNMVGNKRKIALGPYKDYCIIRTEQVVDIKKFKNTDGDVQRLSLDEGVEPQADGGRKIQLYSNKNLGAPIILKKPIRIKND